MIQKTFLIYEHYYKDFDNQFRPLPEVVAYDTSFVDPQADVTPIVIKTYTIRTNWSTKIPITKLLIKAKVLT